MSRSGLERVQHVLDAELQVLGQLVDGRGTTGLRRQPLVGLLDLEGLLLGATGNVHGPPEIPEVALQLSEDRGHRERRERGSAFGVEAVDRLHKPEAGHLEKIVEWLPRSGVTAREVPREGQEAIDQLCSRALVT